MTTQGATAMIMKTTHSIHLVTWLTISG